MTKKEISLLGKQSFDLTPIGRIINWLTTVGRFIIVFTELIVITAFLSRFWLDRRNSDLSERIRQYRAILESATDFENEFRSFQKRLKEVSSFLKNEKDLTEPLSVVAERIPDDVLLTGFSLSQGSQDKETTASLSILIFSETGLSNFINGLLTDPAVDSVRVGMIKREKLTSGTKINLLVSFKNGNKEK